MVRKLKQKEIKEEKVLSGISKELFTYMHELTSVANELNKFVSSFNHVILDMTGTSLVAGASLLMPDIRSVYRYQRYRKPISNQNNLFYFQDIELSLDTVIAYDRTVGMLCIDSLLSDDEYFYLEPLIEVVNPPIMILGESNQVDILQSQYEKMYTFSSMLDANKQLGKVMYNVRKRKRGC